MNHLTSYEVVGMFLSLATILTAARLLSEVARRLNQPSVIGEIFAGILLGPTVLGVLAPGWADFLFPSKGNNAVVLDGLKTLAIALFLLVAGMEVDLTTIWRQGKTAVRVGISGIVFPFMVGFAAPWLAPKLLGLEEAEAPLIFALFFAIALSISALPIIAKTLMDLHLYRTDLGMIIITAAIFNDLIGWVIFAIILGLMGASSHNGMGIGATILLTTGYTAGMLTVGRWLIHRALPWHYAYTIWPGGVLGFILSLALFGAAFTEWIGIHAVFGSFLLGVAVGESSHLREETRTTIDQFISFIFAPLFFASIGLRINFAAHFDGWLTLTVLVLALAGKVTGCGLGARWGGMRWREAWAVGFGMSSVGTMGIILGLVALQNGVIQEPMFVALVIMALITSMMSGPAMERILKRKKPRRFSDFLSAKMFVDNLEATDRFESIKELAKATIAASGLKEEVVLEAVLARERIMPTGLGNGLAVPHARIDGLSGPLIGVGLSRVGIDFDAPDGEPAQIIILILTPGDDDGAQLEILADIARTFRQPHVRKKSLQVGGFVEFLALLRSEKIVESLNR